MKNVKSLQSEYKHTTRILAGLEQLEVNYANNSDNATKPGNVEKGIQEIISISLEHELMQKSSKSYSNEELLAELEEGDFIPEEEIKLPAANE
jgi:hypothetical protein